jgi:hypothetical protein
MENPYQASNTIQSMPAGRTYKDAATLTLLVKLCLIGSMIGAIGNILTSLRQQDTFARAQADGLSLDEAYAELGLEFFAAPLAQLLFLLSGYVITGMWIHRIASNTRFSVGPRYMDFTPAWAVGWYFIPFANLWKPYQSMKELWTLNFAKNPAHPAEASLLLPIWWFLWLAWNGVSNFAGRMSWRAKTFEQESNASVANIVSDSLGFLLCLVFLFIVHRLYAAQSARGANPAAEPVSSGFAEPPTTSPNGSQVIPGPAYPIQ